MNLNVINYALRTVSQGQNAGQKFMEFTLQDPNDFYGQEYTWVCFLPQVAKVWGQYINDAVSTPGQFGRPVWSSTLKDQNKPIPEKMLVINHIFVETYQFPSTEPMVRVDDNNNVVMNQKTGLPQIASSITVICKKTMDNETQELFYPPQEDPQRKGMRLMQMWYRPASQLGIATKAPGNTAIQAPGQQGQAQQNQQQAANQQQLNAGAQQQGQVQQNQNVGMF